MVVVRLICNLVSVWVDGLDQVYLLLGGVGKKGSAIGFCTVVVGGLCCFWLLTVVVAGSRLATFFCFLLVSL
jgi:hypothetical protein